MISPLFLVLLSFCIYTVKCGDNPLENTDEIGDITIKCKRSSARRYFHFQCNFTDHRNPSPSCSQHSVLPRFDKLSLECETNTFISSKRTSCKIVELEGDTPGQQKEVFHLNGTLFLDISAGNWHVYDILANFESILSNAFSFGEAFMRCETHGYLEKILSCGLFGIGDRASVSGNVSCSLVRWYTGENVTVIVNQCGFKEDHLLARYRGNATFFMTFSDFEKMDLRIFFAAQSDSPNDFIMETDRLNCRVLRDDSSNIVCGVQLNEGRFCEDPACCESQASGRGGVESQETIDSERKRDIIWELERTLTLDIEEVGVTRREFLCHMGTPHSAYVAKCTSRISEGHSFVHEKVIVGVAMNRSEVSINSAQLIFTNITERHSFHILIVKSCNLNVEGASKIIMCGVRIGKEVRGDLRCKLQEEVKADGRTEYQVSCTLNILDGFTFEGNFVTGMRESTVYQIDMNGALQMVGNDGNAYPVTSSCGVNLLIYDQIKVTCRIDYGGVDRFQEFLNQL